MKNTRCAPVTGAERCCRKAPGPRLTLGFSLIELLIALAIFSVVALGASAAMLTTMRNNRVSRETSIATTLALDRIERIRTDAVNGIPVAAANGVTASGIYSIAVTVPDPAVPVVPAGVRAVRVAVTWPGSGTRSVTLRTLVRP